MHGGNTMKKIYFITGSQDLYGEETLAQAAADSKEMAAYLGEKLRDVAVILYDQNRYSHGNILPFLPEP